MIGTLTNHNPLPSAVCFTFFLSGLFQFTFPFNKLSRNNFTLASTPYIVKKHNPKTTRNRNKGEKIEPKKKKKKEK